MRCQSENRGVRTGAASQYSQGGNAVVGAIGANQRGAKLSGESRILIRQNKRHVLQRRHRELIGKEHRPI